MTARLLALYPFDTALRFEELEIVPGCNVLASGTAGIDYAPDGGWAVGWIDLDNVKMDGPEVPLAEGDPLYALLVRRIHETQAEAVDLAIELKLAERGVAPEVLNDPLTGCELGVGSRGPALMRLVAAG